MGLLKHRIHFYHTLATLEDAGVPRVRALQQHFPAPFGRVARDMSRTIQSAGVPLGQAMAGFPKVFSPFERNLVIVGERTGRLELIYRSLAEWFQLVQSSRAQVISALIYPIILYHVAAVLIPGIGVVTGQATLDAGLRRMLVLLGMPYAVLFFMTFIRPRLFRSGLPLPALTSALVLAIPVVGTLVRKLNYARFFQALSISLQSGLGMPEAVKLSADSCTNAHLRTRLQRVAQSVSTDGCTFTAAFKVHLRREAGNSLIITMMETGELSGAPDDMAVRIARVYGEESEQSIKRLTTVAPILVYLGIAMYIGLQVVKFYKNMAEQIQSFM